MEDYKEHYTVLGRENWEDWFLETRFRLQSKKVWYTVEKTRREVAWMNYPALGEDHGSWNTERAEKYDGDEATALFYIVKSLGRDDKPCVHEHETAKKLWAYLYQRYSRTSEATVSMYMEKLQSFQVDPEKGIDNAWAMLKNYRRKIYAADAEMKAAYPDSSLFRYLTRSLPEQYKTVVDSLKMQPFVTVEDKLKLLTQFEEEINTSAEKAHAAFRKPARYTRNRPSSDSESDNTPRRCHICLRRGHFQRSCPYLTIAQDAVKKHIRAEKDAKGTSKPSSSRRSLPRKEKGRKAQGLGADASDSDSHSDSSNDPASEDDSEPTEDCHLSKAELRN